MGADRFPSLRAEERRVLTFDFSADLAPDETLTAVAARNVDVLLGTTALPENILSGEATISNGTSVLQVIDHLVAGVDYAIEIVCATNNPGKVLACAGKIYCEG